MRVLLAPDCFTGTLTAVEAAHALAAGWQRHAPQDALECCPLSDGGPGFIDVLAQALGGELLQATVPGPLGDPVRAGVLMVDTATGAGGPAGSVRTAYLETAQACGLHLVPPGRRDPGLTSTAGVAALLEQARGAGATRVVLGLGGSGTNDAGAGMLAALAGAPVPAGGAALAGITAADLSWLPDLRERWRGTELVIASDVDCPLLGFHGASAGFAAQKGAGPERAQQLERCLGDFAAAATAALGDGLPGDGPLGGGPLGGGPLGDGPLGDGPLGDGAAASAPRTLPIRTRPLDATGALAARPGAGAAGGLGYGLMLLGAERVSGVQAVIEAVGLTRRLAASDLVVTGEGTFDWQSLRGKVVAGVARAALELGTPVVVVAGQVLVGRREAQSIGIESAYPVARTPAEVGAALADPAGTLAARAERVARTWSR